MLHVVQYSQWGIYSCDVVVFFLGGGQEGAFQIYILLMLGHVVTAGLHNHARPFNVGPG